MPPSGASAEAQLRLVFPLNAGLCRLATSRMTQATTPLCLRRRVTAVINRAGTRLCLCVPWPETQTAGATCTSSVPRCHTAGLAHGRRLRRTRTRCAAGSRPAPQRYRGAADEEGPPAGPPLESSDGEIFEDQFVTGLALDVTNTERLTLTVGEELSSPSQWWAPPPQ